METPTTTELIETLATSIERDFCNGDLSENRYATPGQEYPELHVSFFYTKGGYYGPSKRGFYISISPYDNGHHLLSKGALLFVSPTKITRVSKKAERDARAELVAPNLRPVLESVLA